MQKSYNSKKPQNKYIPWIIGSVFVLLLVIIFMPNSKKAEKVVKLDNGNVEIDISKLSSKGTYYTYNYEGTKMEFFAVQDRTDKLRMAFNRCQVCYGTGRGYFVQEGDEFVCQNCGNRYSLSMIGKEKGGCNPSPIMGTDRIIKDNKVEILESIFNENEYMFK